MNDTSPQSPELTPRQKLIQYALTLIAMPLFALITMQVVVAASTTNGLGNTLTAEYTSLALDSNDNPHVSFSRTSSEYPFHPQERVDLAVCDDPACDPDPVYGQADGDDIWIDESGAGWETSLKLDSSDRVVMSYALVDTNDLMLARCNPPV
jgi:hypothetical protein